MSDPDLDPLEMLVDVVTASGVALDIAEHAVKKVKLLADKHPNQQLAAACVFAAETDLGRVQTYRKHLLLYRKMLAAAGIATPNVGGNTID